MTSMILLFLVTFALTALAYWAKRVIEGDGYADSRRQPPRSHPVDAFEPHRGPTRLA
ncbi:MAG TPA: hypothetical protein VLA97_02710 [Nocardioidaceae bacterium]|nr:hypothetical protein [Nocardioidaceae bacterium]